MAVMSREGSIGPNVFSALNTAGSHTGNKVFLEEEKQYQDWKNGEHRPGNQ
jgi:hypothetical protein